MAITRAALEDKIIDSGFSLVGSSATAEKAWEDLKNGAEPDLVLLDINLAGEKDGVWLAQKIREEYEVAIVYLTAFGDANTLDLVEQTKPNGYLMKPYNTPTLLTTIKIAIEGFKKSQEDKEPTDSIIFIKDSSLRIKLNVKEIYYVQSDGNYLNIVLKNKKHVIRSKMSDFKKELFSSEFLRVHQRYIVNINKIEQVGSDHITIAGLDIRLSGNYKTELKKALNFH